MPVLAIKPFSSGDRDDAKLLQGLQDHELSLDEINPFFFPAPLAPFVAARLMKRSVRLGEVVGHIRFVLTRFPQLQSRSPTKRTQAPVLLIEGAGGLLVPLGDDFSVLDLIHCLRCAVVVVAPNKLGTINHSRLTIGSLQNRRPYLSRTSLTGAAKSQAKPVGTAQEWLKLVLVDQEFPDPSAACNTEMLRELVAPIPVHTLSFFRANGGIIGAIEKIEKKIEKTLAQILH